MRDLRSGATRQDVQRYAIDCMIAVTALEHQARLVSNNALFAQMAQIIPSLELVSWTGK